MPNREPSPALRPLIVRLPFVAEDRYGISDRERRFAALVQKEGAAAIPLVLPYLKHPVFGVRKLAVEILNHIKGLNDSHLDALIQADRRESLWLSPAIAHIGTPRAVAYLAEDLKRRKHPTVYSPLGSAFEILGTKGTGALCLLLGSSKPDEDELRYTIKGIFQSLDTAARQTAVTPLLTLAQNEKVTLANRGNAIYLLGNLGVAGRSAIPKLQSLARQKPALREWVSIALVELNGPEAVPILLDYLHQPGKSAALVLRGLGKLQRKGKAACPEITRWLRSSDWDARVEAVYALGFIGCSDTASRLVPLLSNQEDWRLVWAAAESLGRFGFHPAQKELNRVANFHWYPPVRETAKLALGRIEKQIPYPYLSEEEYHYWGFARYQNAFAKYGKDYGNEPQNGVGQELAVAGGKLVGTDKGEWGGALVFTPDGKPAKEIMSQNVCAVAALGPHSIAVTGLAHLSINEGDLYRVVQDANGDWAAIRWRALPGAPRWAQVREDVTGPVLRVTCQGGVVDVSADGTMRWVVP